MVFCTKCGKQNIEGAKYCEDCGELINRPRKVITTTKKVRKGDIKQENKRKDPWVAVLINLLIAGLGMVYLGRYAKAVLSFIMVWIAGVISVLVFNNVFILAIVGYILVMAWCYDEAKKVNLERGYN